MRIEVVVADAFGPFHGDKLELASGMNVLFGPNEAGKSTWHAAIFAGLCGRKRGVGSGTVDAKAFAARHRPWVGEEWSASVVIVLENGRRIRIGQDLEGGVDCQATEVAMGRDVSAEIMFEGTPDGGRYLGLDRKAFVSTACIRQADLSGVTRDAAELQTHLQRAAAAHGTDATAAAALETIEVFKREHVGLARANSSKPLQQAIVKEREARAALERARSDAAARVAREEEAHAASIEAEERRAEVSSLESALLQSRLATARADLVQAESLSAALAVEAPPAPDKDEIREAREAVAGWEAAPEIVTLSGPSALQLEAELSDLPEPSTTDEEPALEVVEAVERVRDARRRLDLVVEEEPALSPRPNLEAEPRELRAIASSLREPRPPAPAIGPAPSTGLANSLRSRRTALLVASGVLALIGVAGFALEPVIGVAGLVAAVAAAVIAALNQGKLSAAEASERARSQAEQAADSAERAWNERHSNAVERAHALGLGDDPQGIDDLALDLEATERDRAAHDRWQTRRDEVVKAIDDADRNLRSALEERDAPPSGDDALKRFEAYRGDCAVSRSRRELQQRITSTQEAASRATASKARVDRLRAFAEAHDIDGERHPDLIAMDLKGWVIRAEEALEGLNEAEQNQVELDTLLRGRSLDELRSDVQALEAEQANEPRLAVGSSDEIERDLHQVRIQARTAEERAHTLRGELSQLIVGMMPVADAEEDLRVAAEDLKRLQTLGHTLETTLRFLEQAQDRVHRDIAPVLNATIDAYLGRVTGGHYVKAAVDPASLKVSVVEAHGQYRDVTRLSHGTAEQIYLLLRVALAEHLTTPGEVCPLILDDVTVQSDVTRTRAILEVLQDLAEERQVVLFTQEDDVREWAENNLSGEQHRLQYLSL